MSLARSATSVTLSYVPASARLGGLAIGYTHVCAQPWSANMSRVAMRANVTPAYGHQITLPCSCKPLSRSNSLERTGYRHVQPNGVIERYGHALICPETHTRVPGGKERYAENSLSIQEDMGARYTLLTIHPGLGWSLGSSDSKPPAQPDNCAACRVKN